MSKLEKKVITVPTFNIDKKKVLAFCDFKYHRGLIVKYDTVKKCVSRDCRYLNLYQLPES